MIQNVKDEYFEITGFIQNEKRLLILNILSLGILNLLLQLIPRLQILKAAHLRDATHVLVDRSTALKVQRIGAIRFFVLRRTVHVYVESINTFTVYLANIGSSSNGATQF